MTLHRIGHLARNILVSNFRRPSFPYKLTLILTYRCNCRCKMCHIWKKENKEELSLEELRRFFQVSNEFSWINISGGEIFLRKDLLDIVKTMFKKCRHLYLLDFPTTGMQTGLVLETTEEILSLNPGRLMITVSLDGPPDLHDEMRGIPGIWEKAVETFRQLKTIRRSNFEVYLGMTLFSHNIDKFPETYSAVKERIGDLTYRDFHVNLGHMSEHYYGNEGAVGVSPEEASAALNRFVGLKGKSLNPVSYLESRYQRLAQKYLETQRCPLPCQALSASCFIDPRGDIYPCLIHNERLGNLKDFDFDLRTAWQSPAVVDMRREILKGNCIQCWTPCEAYQTILGNLWPLKTGGGTHG